MEPVKFEEQIKKQLQKREIKPSAGAWEKLQGRLEQGEKPKQAQIWWLGVAAAIAGVFFFLGTLFNSQTENRVVEQNAEENVPVESVEKRKEVLITSEITETERVSDPGSLPQKVKVPEVQMADVIQEESVSESDSGSRDMEIVPDRQTEISVAEVKYKAPVLSDSEIEVLLKTAMAELDQEPSLYREQTVDAGELLNEVEYELEQNFRQKVFEVLKQGFSKAKMAVADRK